MQVRKGARRDHENRQGIGHGPSPPQPSGAEKVRTAVVPVAGATPGMWPATKIGGPWLFPVRVGDAVKPAICWLCEDLIDAGIEKIIFIVSQSTEDSFKHLFMRREEDSILNKVSAKERAYDEELINIGKKIVFVRQDRPSGIKEAILMCEQEVNAEPFLLAWGDHLCSKGCVSQLLNAYDGTSAMIGMKTIGEDMLGTCGVLCSLEPPCPLPPPLGPRQNPAKVVTWPISKLAEKPNVSTAEEQLLTPGLTEAWKASTKDVLAPPGNRFLASFGQYVLPPSFLAVLRKPNVHHFTSALDTLRQQEGLCGVLITQQDESGQLIEGSRWDLGDMKTYVGALRAQAQTSDEPSLTSFPTSNTASPALGPTRV